VGTNEGGVLFTVRLPEAIRTATLSYRFKFDRDYDWTHGGKLPGLCDEACPTGCAAKTDDGGWSGRVHWRTEGDLVSYMYLPGTNPLVASVLVPVHTPVLGWKTLVCVTKIVDAAV
jgi:hypothetical protein